MRKPAIDLSLCTICEACIAACPEVFVLNDVGYIDVVDRKQYPEDEVDEAIKYCPEDAIYWEVEG